MHAAMDAADDMSRPNSAPADDSAAFSAFVHEHVHLVYSAALRQTGGHHHDAEDITQQVFALAARNADRLARHPCPLAWLHLVVRNLARNHRRAERRLLAMADRVSNDPTHASPEPVPDWERLSPLLDDALATLGPNDREAILLRFFAQKPFADIALRLRLGENAARMRTERALEKLRRALARRGVRSTSAALAVAFGEHAVVAAPDSLVRLAVSPALSATSAAIPLGALPLLSLVMNTSKWLLPSLAFAAGITTGLIIPHGETNPSDHFPDTTAQTPPTAAPSHVSFRSATLPTAYTPPSFSAPPALSPGEPSVQTLAKFKSIRFPTLTDELAVTPEAITLLGLTPEEIRAIGQVWSNAKISLDRLVSERIQVKSQTDAGALLNIPAIPEGSKIRDEIQNRLREILGEQRAQVFVQNSESTERQVMLGFGETPVKIELTWLSDGRINIQETHRYSSIAMAYDELPKRFENVILRRR